MNGDRTPAPQTPAGLTKEQEFLKQRAEDERKRAEEEFQRQLRIRFGGRPLIGG